MLSALSQKTRLIIALFVFFLVSGGLVYFFTIKPKLAKDVPPSGKEKTAEEILQSLTAPSGGEKTEVSAQILKSLTAPSKKGASEDIIKSLTAPPK